MNDVPRFTLGGAESTVGASSGAELEPQIQALFDEFGEPAPPVAVVVSERSEREQMQACEDELSARGIGYQTHVLSMLRDAPKLTNFAETAALRGIRVIIVAAGESCSLPAMIAAYSDLPVIGVPLLVGPLAGLDSLLATVQSPDGVPVACMSIGGARNGAIFAANILSAMPLAPVDGE